MKAIFKIVVALLLVLAAFNATWAAFADYQFSDAVHARMLFMPDASEAELTDAILYLAAEHEIPLYKEDVAIRQIGQELRVTMSYTKTVVLIPGVFSKDWTFNPVVSMQVLPGSGRR